MPLWDDCTTQEKEELGFLTVSDSNEWLQIDLLSKHTIVTGVATQGRKVQNNSSKKAVWVIKYKLQYGDDGKNFKNYTEKHTNGGEKVRLRSMK